MLEVEVVNQVSWYAIRGSTSLLYMFASLFGCEKSENLNSDDVTDRMNGPDVFLTKTENDMCLAN